MADAPYTSLAPVQFRGPSSSDSYNERIENEYKDLVVLFNRARITEEDLREAYSRLIKDHVSLTNALQDLLDRIAVLESGSNTLTFYNATQIDTARFNGTGYAVPSVSQCYWDAAHGVLVLPKVLASSLSKLYFVNQDGSVSVPSTLETNVLGVSGTADGTGSLIDTSDPALSIGRSTGRLWERNVVVGSANAQGAQCTLYIKAPQDLFSTPQSNAIVFHPFPAMGMDVLEVAYTTSPNVLLNDGDGYTVVNSQGFYANQGSAVGWIAPGGWTGDAAVSMGPRVWYFDPQPITGLRFKLRQPNYLIEGGSYVYSYGASSIDLRYDKFLASGQAIIRFDAPAGKTISHVTSVQPQIWNIDPAQIPNVFSYQAIWETAFNSGIYTSNPVANSKRVWLSVTMGADLAGSTPALSGLSITYN